MRYIGLVRNVELLESIDSGSEIHCLGGCLLRYVQIAPVQGYACLERIGADTSHSCGSPLGRVPGDREHVEIGFAEILVEYALRTFLEGVPGIGIVLEVQGVVDERYASVELHGLVILLGAYAEELRLELGYGLIAAFASEILKLVEYLMAASGHLENGPVFLLDEVEIGGEGRVELILEILRSRPVGEYVGSAVLVVVWEIAVLGVHVAHALVSGEGSGEGFRLACRECSG